MEQGRRAPNRRPVLATVRAAVAAAAAVTVPMLFLQGTRGPRATLHVEEGADHSFHVLKRSGRSDEAVRAELVRAVDEWTRGLPLA
jgi:hypothetical protein